MCSRGVTWESLGARDCELVDPRTCRVPGMALPSTAALPHPGASAAAALQPDGAAPPRVPVPLRAPPPSRRRAVRPPAPAPAASGPRPAAPAHPPHPARAAAVPGRSPHPARRCLPAAALSGVRRTPGRRSACCPRARHPALVGRPCTHRRRRSGWAARPLRAAAARPGRRPRAGTRCSRRGRRRRDMRRTGERARPLRVSGRGPRDGPPGAARRSASTAGTADATPQVLLQPGGALRACRSRSLRAGLGGTGESSCSAERARATA
jgi:hypothetical protein